jgi:hypothetical protein
MAFVDRESKYPNRVLITPETGESFYATVVRADEPFVVGTPLNSATLNELVNKNGDTLNGSLTLENLNSYHTFMKYRDVEGKIYGVNGGCGVLGGKGVIAFEVREGHETTSPRLARLEIGELGVSYIDPNGKRTYLHQTGVLSAGVE